MHTHTPTQWMFTLLSIVLCGGCWVQTPHQPSLGQLYLLSILNISSKMTGPSRPAQQSIEMRRHNPVLLWPLCCQSVPSLGQRKDRLGPRLGQRPAWACPGEQQRENICFNWEIISHGSTILWVSQGWFPVSTICCIVEYKLEGGGRYFHSKIWDTKSDKIRQ